MSYVEIKKMLEDMVAEKNRTKLDSDRKEFISTTAKRIMESMSPEDKKGMMEMVGKDMVKMLEPLLIEFAKEAKISREELRQIMSELKFPEPVVNYQPPEINIPDIKVPTPQVNYTPPAIRIPEIKMPEEMDIRGWVQLQGVDLQHPLPVQLRDKDGKPVNLLENLTTIIGGGGSGKSDYFTVKGFGASAYADYINSDNRLRVSTEPGGAGLTDAELRASHLDVQQVSGAIDSVWVNGFSASVAATILNGEGLARDSWLVSDVTASVKAALVDSGGVQYSGSNPVPITGTMAVSGVTASVGASLLGGDGGSLDPRNRNWTITETVPISTIQSFEVKQVSGFNDSVYVTGFSASVAASILNGDGASLDPRNRNWSITETVAVSGSLDTVKASGIARQTNPATVSDGDNIRFTADDLGRQLVRPVQVRDLMATAYVAKVSGSTFGTETTLLGATAGSMFDLVYIMGTNDSNAAIVVDIRGVTAGNVLMSICIPAGGTAGIALPVPLPQTAVDTGNAWTIDLPDVTGTNVYVSALFSKEI